MTLIATRLDPIRHMYDGRLDQHENRRTTYGLLDTAIRQMAHPRAIINSQLREEAMRSQGRTLSIPVYQKGSVTVSNTRTCTIGTHDSTSARVDVTWKMLSTSISMDADLYDNNEMMYNDDLAKKIGDVVEAFNIVIENDIDALLDTNKSQVYNSPFVGAGLRYPTTTNTLQVATGVQEHFFNDIDAINQDNDYEGSEIVVVGNPTLKSYVRTYRNQGNSNDENLLYQFDGFDFTFSRRVTNATGKVATGYWMQPGAIGILSRVNRAARNNRETTVGKLYSTQMLPGFPFPVAVMYESDCTDLSSKEADMTADVQEKWQFSVEIGLLAAYIDDLTTDASPYGKFEFL